MYDVAVIGYGPVGMVTAALLGQAGHDVVVLERYPGLYNLPRAAIFDDETMRTFARLGISDVMLPKVHVQRNYEWRNADGELLIEHEFAERGKSGWAEWYMMYQPDLEDALDNLCQALPNVEVRTSSRVTALHDDGLRVVLTVENTERPVEARYVIACDGGNSFTRQHLGIEMEDLRFSEPWMVCDFRLKRPVNLPMARQVCNPAQPESIISIGPDHHRFSFMLNSEADFPVESQPERVWARVADFIDEDVAEMIRVATYTFQSRIAHRWREGRVVLAGDSAHQMSPFLGQGMCSGIRDAQNLAFKLDRILAGQSDDGLLDTYQTEREPHVRAIILKGKELGSVQTMRDPVAAAVRDEQFLARRRANHKPDKFVFPGIGPGLLATGATPARGQLMIQGTVTVDDATGRFDERLGYGFQLLVGPDLHSGVTPELLDGAEALGVGVHLLDSGSGVHHGPVETTARVVADTEGAYADWFAANSAAAVLVRPDFYVYGTATTPAELRQLLEDLERGLTATSHSLASAR
ncbi:bifunctional 3-(3-hydroxy-phenyl)propionate/3-hydroxycinnamic acid hydroxylase [Georgenia daeguensis]|uniref:Bifunctional 3-(3-hydroxy-phenyl)propionate/3-hydroxycinnamic acid hydroxylase n=1 Tax=Georgenia daeguensis TaxID=908355 RepID=A0ABP8EXZ1_9MICO